MRMINSNQISIQYQLMSHRLQHLHKRRIQASESANTTKESDVISKEAGSAPNLPRSYLSTTKSRPNFPPSNTIQLYSKSNYKKGEKAFPPPEYLYIAKDTQVHPAFLRATTIALHNLPRKNNIPIAVWITPFANDRVSVIEMKAPLRCSGCKAYVNPYFQFDGTRRAATCNLCGIRFPIGESIDKVNLQSAEIATQSIIDFKVSQKIYFKKRTDIIKLIAVIQLSMNTLELNIFSTVLLSLKSAFQSQQFGQKIRISIVFYSDQGVSYLQRGTKGVTPTIFLVPSNKNNLNCCPLSEDEMFFDPIHQQQELIASLDFLQTYGDSFKKQGKYTHTASYIHALRSIKECFSNHTGKILLFSCLDPREGACAIRNRSEQEQRLPFKPLHMQIHDMGRQFVKLRIGIQHFYFGKDNLISHQLSTTHFLASLTGGETHLYNGFNHESANSLYYQIFHSLTRPNFFDADFTCRLSPGLNVSRYGVPEGFREGRDVPLSILSDTSSFLVEIEQQEKLSESQGAFIQFAMLYTTMKGQRRIRVINYCFEVTFNLETHYDSIDYLTFANFIARSYSQRLLKVDQISVKEDAMGYLAALISEFQGKCQHALSAKVGGVIVPEGLAWALYYLHSVFSSRLFLRNQRDINDSRMDQYLKMQSLTPYFFSSRYYPHLYPLTLDIYDQEPLPGDFLEADNEDNQKVAVLPPTLPLTRESIRDNAVYLFDAGDELLILVQPLADEELLMDLFGTTNWEQLEKEGLPELETAHNIRVNNIIAEIRRRNSSHGGMYQPLRVKTPLKKKQYLDLLASVLKEDTFQSSFREFIELIRQAVSPQK